MNWAIARWGQVTDIFGGGIKKNYTILNKEEERPKIYAFSLGQFHFWIRDFKLKETIVLVILILIADS